MNRIHDAFDAVHATDEQKGRARAAVLAAMRAEQRGQIADGNVEAGAAAVRRAALCTTRARRMFPLAACLLAVLIFGAGWMLYFTPVAAVAIDINPSLELTVNRFDAVLEVRAYNEAAERVADEVDVRFQPYEQAVDAILESDAVQSLTAAGEQVAITVAASDTSRCEAMYECLEGCAQRHGNASCYQASLTAAEAEEAHHAGLSIGRWGIYQDLLAAGADIAPDAVNSMTMRELRGMLANLTGDGGAAQSGRGQGAHAGAGAADGQQGNGHRDGTNRHGGSGVHNR